MKLSDYLKIEKIDMTTFGEIVGISQPYISLICTGKRRPSPEVAEQIQNATSKKVTILELLFPK